MHMLRSVDTCIRKVFFGTLWLPALGLILVNLSILTKDVVTKIPELTRVSMVLYITSTGYCNVYALIHA